MRTRNCLLNISAELAVGLVQVGFDAPLARAQSAAILTGHVSSAEEGPMEGVVVSARKDAATITVSVVTDQEGKNTFPAGRLEPGRYQLSIRAGGYELESPKDVDLSAAEPATAEIKLRAPVISCRNSPTANGSPTCRAANRIVLHQARTVGKYATPSTFMPRRANNWSRDCCTRARSGEADIDQFSGPFARRAGDEHRVDVSGVGNSRRRIGQRQRVDVARPDEDDVGFLARCAVKRGGTTSPRLLAPCAAQR
jgi:hypothetical protein